MNSKTVCSCAQVSHDVWNCLFLCSCIYISWCLKLFILVLRYLVMSETVYSCAQVSRDVWNCLFLCSGISWCLKLFILVLRYLVMSETVYSCAQVSRELCAAVPTPRGALPNSGTHGGPPHVQHLRISGSRWHAEVTHKNANHSLFDQVKLFILKIFCLIFIFIYPISNYYYLFIKIIFKALCE